MNTCSFGLFGIWMKCLTTIRNTQIVLPYRIYTSYKHQHIQTCTFRAYHVRDKYLLLWMQSRFVNMFFYVYQFWFCNWNSVTLTRRIPSWQSWLSCSYIIFIIVLFLSLIFFNSSLLYSGISEWLNILTSDRRGPCLWVCLCVCVSVCVSVEALAPKRLDRF